MNSVNKVKGENLCISCGICLSICPKNAIHYEKNSSGTYLPIIDDEKCINCGRCLKVCPGLGISKKVIDLNEGIIKNRPIHSFVGASIDEELVENSTSGGIVTSLIKELLDSNEYQYAFMPDGYHYESQSLATIHSKNDSLSNTTKSRYLTVSHCETAKYMIEHPNEKIIIVGTPCALLGITNIINLKNLDRNNYFFIGLFCDKTMSYNVIEYFEQHPKIKSKIEEFYFRTKESNKWPGNVEAICDNNKKVFLDKSERMKIKDYFCMERCLYCIDKLNHLADISVGDNYTSIKLDNFNGSSTILVNTEPGNNIWHKYSHLFEYRDCPIEEVYKSQHLDMKKQNLKNIKYKGSSIYQTDVKDLLADSSSRKQYQDSMKKIKLGENKKYKKIYFKTHFALYKLLRKIANKVK